MLDHESGGCIRYRVGDLTGLFNSYGQPIIPAEYNYLLPVYQGRLVARKGAQKEYLEKDRNDSHYIWQGGQWMLIDTNNHILIEELNGFIDLDLNSIQKHPEKHSDTLRENFGLHKGAFIHF